MPESDDIRPAPSSRSNNTFEVSNISGYQSGVDSTQILIREEVCFLIFFKHKGFVYYGVRVVSIGI